MSKQDLYALKVKHQCKFEELFHILEIAYISMEKLYVQDVNKKLPIPDGSRFLKSLSIIALFESCRNMSQILLTTFYGEKILSA